MIRCRAAFVGISLFALAAGAKTVSLAETQAPRFDQLRVIENVSAVPARAEPETVGAKADDLEAREKALAEREELLKAYEAKVAMQVEEMKAIRDELASQRAAIAGQGDEDRRKLAFMYGNMKARDAAEILTALPMETVVGIIDSMSDVQATALMGAMPPDLAGAVTKALLDRTKER